MKKILNTPKFIFRIKRFNKNLNITQKIDNISENQEKFIKINKRKENLENLNKNIEIYYKPNIKNDINAILSQFIDNPNDKIEFQVYFHLGWTNYLQNQKEESFKYYKKAMEVILNLDINFKNVYLFLTMSKLENDVYQAFDNVIKSIHEFDRYKNEDTEEYRVLEYLVINNYTSMFKEITINLTERKFNQEIKLKYLNLIKNLENLGKHMYIEDILYFNLGLNMFYSKDLQTDFYLKKALIILENKLEQYHEIGEKSNHLSIHTKEYSQILKRIEIIFTLLSRFYLERRNEDDCLYYLEKLEKLDIIHDEDNQIDIYYMYSTIAFQKKRFDLAKEYIDKIDIKSIKTNDTRASIYQLKFIIYTFCQKFKETNDLFSRIFENFDGENLDHTDHNIYYLMNQNLSNYINHQEYNHIQDALFLIYLNEYQKSFENLENLEKSLPESLSKIPLQLILCHVSHRVNNINNIPKLFEKIVNTLQNYKNNLSTSETLITQVVNNLSNINYQYNYTDIEFYHKLLFKVLSMIEKDSKLYYYTLYELALIEVKLKMSIKAIRKLEVLIDKMDHPLQKFECYLGLAESHLDISKNQMEKYFNLAQEIAIKSNNSSLKEKIEIFKRNH